MTDETTVQTTSDLMPSAQQGSKPDLGPQSSSAADVLPKTLESEVSFTSQLPEDLRKEPSLSNIKDLTSLAKGYVNAQKMIGNSVRIPGPDASDEVKKDFYAKVTGIPGVIKLPNPSDKAGVDEFFTKLGRPASPDAYKLSVPEGMPVNDAALKSFKEVAYNLGLNNAQTQALMGFEAGRMGQAIDQMKQQQIAAKQVLNEVWGNEYENRISSARTLTEHYGQKYPDAVKSLVNGPAGNNPVFLMMAAELGKFYSESGAIKGQPVRFGLTAEEARSRIEEIKSNKAHPYFTEKNPKLRAKIIEEMSELYEKANPSTGESD